MDGRKPSELVEVGEPGSVYAPTRDLFGESHTGFKTGQIPRVILSVCLTGFGSAAKIAELIEEHLSGLHEQGVEIICMDISLSSKTETEVQRLVGNRHVVAVFWHQKVQLVRSLFIYSTLFVFSAGVLSSRGLRAANYP